MSEVIPKRIDRCACGEWCPPGEFYCCGHCRAAADERSAQAHVGGSLERHQLDYEERGESEEVGGTRQRFENSPRGDGYE
jgi:hypothetical protein